MNNPIVAKPTSSPPLSEPQLARRPPAELMVFSDKRPSSIRIAAHASLPVPAEPDGERAEPSL